MADPRARSIMTAGISGALIAFYAVRVPEVPIMRVADVMVVIFLFALACSSIERVEGMRR